jgi:hypothetical protein
VTVGELALIAVLAVVVWRAADLAFRPWKKCWACKGNGKSWLSGEKYYDDCHWCKGGTKPRELRTGARFVRPDLARKVK